MAALRVIGISLLISLASAVDPVVELSHGGKLRGKQLMYNRTTVDIFLGVPYVQAPLGGLRFKKPQDYPPWTGEMNATTPGSMCPQKTPAGIVGNEDCLFLDITVPGGVNSTNRKPVMVWIHGGGYTLGSKNSYMGAPLAVHGDVITIVINYRLGALGFLAEKSGIGNFGLWDQRAALLWVKENIAMFGGDADLVTIFGESAGAGSVSAQTMSPHNNGLFKRAIQQSGSLFTDWTWYISENQRYELIQGIRQHNNCPSAESVYDCLRDMTVEELFANVVTDDPIFTYWHPFPDDDFFSSNITEETYELTKRFDLMTGFNGQEGLLGLFEFITSQSFPGYSPETGATIEYVRKIIETKICPRANPLSPELCSEFFINKYDLSSTHDDRERLIRLSYMLGEFSFNADSYNQLRKQSSGDTSSYGYYFTQFYNVSEQLRLWPLPEWARQSADHADDTFYVFGAVYSVEFNLLNAYYGQGADSTIEGQKYINYLSGVTDEDRKLVDVMMTMWTNFAHSGNPNQPAALPAGTPAWPQFNTKSTQYMELNSANTRVIITPEKQRLDNLLNTIFNARRHQLNADKAPVPQCQSPAQKGSGKDTVVG